MVEIFEGKVILNRFRWSDYIFESYPVTCLIQCYHMLLATARLSKLFIPIKIIVPNLNPSHITIKKLTKPLTLNHPLHCIFLPILNPNPPTFPHHPPCPPNHTSFLHNQFQPLLFTFNINKTQKSQPISQYRL
jgi:hypothetical protein